MGRVWGASVVCACGRARSTIYFPDRWSNARCSSKYRALLGSNRNWSRLLSSDLERDKHKKRIIIKIHLVWNNFQALLFSLSLPFPPLKHSPLDKHIVWKAGPATRYDDKLSMVSCQSAKHEPRSAKMNVTRGTARERAMPLSCNSTGTPVYFRRQLVLLLTDSYKLASAGQTYT